jgi:hypothetical protein
MEREQHHEPPLGQLHQWLLGELQEAVERGLAAHRSRERPEVQGQEHGEGDA